MSNNIKKSLVILSLILVSASGFAAVRQATVPNVRGYTVQQQQPMRPQTVQQQTVQQQAVQQQKMLRQEKAK